MNIAPPGRLRWLLLLLLLLVLAWLLLPAARGPADGIGALAHAEAPTQAGPDAAASLPAGPPASEAPDTAQNVPANAPAGAAAPAAGGDDAQVIAAVPAGEAAAATATTPGTVPGTAPDAASAPVPGVATGSAAGVAAESAGSPPDTVDAAPTDIFAVRSWAPPPPPPDGSPPPPPAAPPLPFKFLGRIVLHGGATSFMLTHGERVLIVRVGDTVAGSYRLEKYENDRLLFRYRPMNLRQALATGGRS